MCIFVSIAVLIVTSSGRTKGYIAYLTLSCAVETTERRHILQCESESQSQSHRPGKRTGWPLSLTVRAMAARVSAWRSS